MITFNNVAYRYAAGQNVAVQNIEFNLPKGSFHFLCGPSGAGKTTIFRMLYMDLIPTNGVLTMFDKNVKKLSRQEIAIQRRRMGIVFQDFRLLNHLNVEENVSLPLSLHGPLSKEQQESVKEILSWVGLGHKLEAYPEELSGGEKQRVGIARAVVGRPQLLIADEPTGNVDEKMGKRIMHLFCELHRHGTTVLIATHDQSLVDAFKFPCLYMDEGKLVSHKKEEVA